MRKKIGGKGMGKVGVPRKKIQNYDEDITSSDQSNNPFEKYDVFSESDEGPK